MYNVSQQQCLLNIKANLFSISIIILCILKLCTFIHITNACVYAIAEKYRPEQGVEPRVSR